VRVDQSRHKRAVAQIDYLRPRRMLYRRAHLDDLFTLNQHFARFHQASALDIQQTGRMQHNRVLSYGL
jgi:hypothetical protein